MSSLVLLFALFSVGKTIQVSDKEPFYLGRSFKQHPRVMSFLTLFISWFQICDGERKSCVLGLLYRYKPSRHWFRCFKTSLGT